MNRFWLMTVGVCTFAASAATAHAQSASFGVKAGLVAASVSTSGTGAFDTEADPTAAGGAFVTIRITDRLFVQPELLISNRRFTIQNEAGINVRSRSIEVPILVGARLALSGRVRPVLFAGPQFGRIAKVTQTFAGRTADISDQIKDGDGGMVIGGGIEVGAGRGAVSVDARASLGMKDVNAASGPSIKSRAFMLLGGYRF
jgi:hypothetical protein